MQLSKDLIHIENAQGTKWLVYNHKHNKACILDEQLYRQIDFSKNCLESSLILTSEDRNRLIKYGVLIDTVENYEQKSYHLRLDSRNKSVRLNEAYFHLTQRCNLRCSYCYNLVNLGKEDVLNLEKVTDIAHRLKAAGVTHINLTGGEVLLRDDIVEIIRLFKDLGFTQKLLSNGLNLPAKPEVLSLVDSAIISLDTLHESENLRTGLRIEKLLRILKAVPTDLKQKITIRAVISTANENSWQEVKDFAEENKFTFTASMFIPSSKSDFQYMPKKERASLDTVSTNFSGNLCGACTKVIAIDSNGDIYPCQALVRCGYQMTNILKDTWHDELKSSSVTEAFANLDVNSIENCNSCEYRYLCGGGCRAIAINVYGGIEKQAEQMCDYIKDIAKAKLRGLLHNYG